MSDLKQPLTDKRSAPRQMRSNKTVEQILGAAADLLIEVGFEKLSTNGICARAGLTPPALYRYFPNKYAVLKALGERLMDRQNAILDDWSKAPFRLDLLEAQTFTLLKRTLEVTRMEPAGGWIMRSLHASPVLSDVRLDSHRHVTKLLVDRILLQFPTANEPIVYERVRLGIELGYATIEMLFDETNMDAETALKNVSRLLAQNISSALD